MSAISVRHVSKLWGATRAVDDVSFEAPVGKLLVLLGPSGCGKSTTLRLIAGLERVSAGRIHIGDEDVTDRPPAQPAAGDAEHGLDDRIHVPESKLAVRRGETGRKRADDAVVQSLELGAWSLELGVVEALVTKLYKQALGNRSALSTFYFQISTLA